MVVGKTGEGKTTMLNALINYHLGVQLEDGFQYVLINEKNMNKSQALSQTDEVISYEIEAYGGKPALIVVDTPGFCDTRGL